ncbi:MAG: sulfurtransferase TusA family protein [Betaproteobacteria bacterium]
MAVQDRPQTRTSVRPHIARAMLLRDPPDCSRTWEGVTYIYAGANAGHDVIQITMQEVVIDVRGYNCPIPLLRAKKAFSKMSPGQTLKVVTTDPGAEIDFRVFAEASGNKIVRLDVRGNVITILMAKK